FAHAPVLRNCGGPTQARTRHRAHVAGLGCAIVARTGRAGDLLAHPQRRLGCELAAAQATAVFTHAAPTGRINVVAVRPGRFSANMAGAWRKNPGITDGAVPCAEVNAMGIVHFLAAVSAVRTTSSRDVRPFDSHEFGTH